MRKLMRPWGLVGVLTAVALVPIMASAAGAGTSRAADSPLTPVLTGAWQVTGTITSSSDPSFLGQPVGATVQRTWRFAQACDSAACTTDLTRGLELGDVATRITYTGSNAFSWQETLTGQGFCGATSIANAGTVRITWTLNVTTVAIPTGRPVATSLKARGDFVFDVNQGAFEALGCSAPAQVTYTIDYTASSSSPPPSGDQVYAGPAPGFPAGTVKLPGSGSPSSVTAGQNLPPGTIVDVSNGAAITLADPKGRKAVFYGEKDGVPSVFIMAGIVNGFVELRLTGGNFKVCKPSRTVQLVAKKAEKPVRRLWGKGKGSFRTKGRYAAAAVRGTWWLTADYCTRTLVSVKEGVLTVSDLVAKKTVIVKAGKSYSALRP